LNDSQSCIHTFNIRRRKERKKMKRRSSHGTPKPLICYLGGNGPGAWWLRLVIQATQEAEIRKITIQSQPRQIILETQSRKNPSQKRAG
jgi:hypothetical protein